MEWQEDGDRSRLNTHVLKHVKSLGIACLKYIERRHLIAVVKFDFQTGRCSYILLLCNTSKQSLFLVCACVLSTDMLFWLQMVFACLWHHRHIFVLVSHTTMWHQMNMGLWRVCVCVCCSWTHVSVKPDDSEGQRFIEHMQDIEITYTQLQCRAESILN